MADQQSNDDETEGEITLYESSREDELEQLQLFEDLVELEKSRIELARNRNEITRDAIKFAAESDKRQFEYHTQELETSDKRHQRSINLVKQTVFGFGGALLVGLGLVFYMAFYGDPAQSALAVKIITEGAKGLGGGGIIYLALRVLRFLKSG